MKDPQYEHLSDEELLRLILSKLSEIEDTHPERFWNGMQRLAEIHINN